MSARRWPEVVAWSLGALGCAAAAVGVGVGWTVRAVPLPPSVEPGPGAGFFLAALLFVGTGALLAARRPRNRVGWLLLVAGLLAQSTGLAGLARITSFAAHGTPSPWAAWLWDVLWLPGVLLVPMLFLLFPDGRLPGRRWRGVAWLLLLAGTLVLAGVGLRPGPLTNTPVANPLGIAALEPFAAALEALGSVGLVAGTLAAVAAPFVRRRRATLVERYQLRWFAVAATTIVVAWVAADLLAAAGVSAPVLAVVRTAPLLALPLAVTVAVLQHRLYGIDPLVERGVRYAGLAGVVGLVYLTVVVGVGTLVGAREEAGVLLTVLATALAAIAFQPAHRRLVRIADRLVHGPAVQPYDVITTFAHEVAGAHPLGEAPAAVAEAIGEAMRLARCEVWLRIGDTLEVTARWPTGERLPPAPLPHPGQELVLPGADRVHPVQHDGRLLGAIAVATHGHQTLPAAEDRLLGDLAAAAWPVFDNARLVRELRASRRRLVAVQDGERRRLERDLHDGAQQRLLEVALTLQEAHRQAEREGPIPVAGTIAAAEVQLRAALAELRELARGIHPAILSQRGLIAAVSSLAERAPLAVEVRADGAERVPEPVEVTAYFVVAEALANVIKHAGARTATITVTGDDDALHVRIEDDGVGGADPAAPGLHGLADRVAAIGGRLTVTSPRGSGTSVEAVLPCA